MWWKPLARLGNLEVPRIAHLGKPTAKAFDIFHSLPWWSSRLEPQRRFRAIMGDALTANHCQLCFPWSTALWLLIFTQVSQVPLGEVEKIYKALMQDAPPRGPHKVACLLCFASQWYPFFYDSVVRHTCQPLQLFRKGSFAAVQGPSNAICQV